MLGDTSSYKGVALLRAGKNSFPGSNLPGAHGAGH